MAQYAEICVTVSAAGGQLLSHSDKRIAIIFPGPPTNRYTLSGEKIPVLDKGIQIYPLTRPWELWRHYHGQAVTNAWFGISAVADQQIVIGEVFE